MSVLFCSTMATLQEHQHYICMFLIFIENTAHIPLKMRGIYGRNDCGVMHLEFMSAFFDNKTGSCLRGSGNIHQYLGFRCWCMRKSTCACSCSLLSFFSLLYSSSGGGASPILINQPRKAALIVWSRPRDFGDVCISLYLYWHSNKLKFGCIYYQDIR